MADTAGLGICLDDLSDSTVTFLQCPQCGSNAVECTTGPHAHRCHGCGLEGLVYRNHLGQLVSDEED